MLVYWKASSLSLIQALYILYSSFVYAGERVANSIFRRPVSSTGKAILRPFRLVVFPPSSSDFWFVPAFRDRAVAAEASQPRLLEVFPTVLLVSRRVCLYCDLRACRFSAELRRSAFLSLVRYKGNEVKLRCRNNTKPDVNAVKLRFQGIDSNSCVNEANQR